MENVLTEQPFLGKIQVVISKFSSKVKSASYSLAFNGNSAFLRRLIVAVREATPSARSRFLDYSGTHSLCIFAFNFRFTQISAQTMLSALTSFATKLLHFLSQNLTFSQLLFGRVENPLVCSLNFFHYIIRNISV